MFYTILSYTKYDVTHLIWYTIMITIMRSMMTTITTAIITIVLVILIVILIMLIVTMLITIIIIIIMTPKYPCLGSRGNEEAGDSSLSSERCDRSGCQRRGFTNE